VFLCWMVHPFSRNSLLWSQRVYVTYRVARRLLYRHLFYLCVSAFSILQLVTVFSLAKLTAVLLTACYFVKLWYLHFIERIENQ
jgi:uncharacterized membrane protein